jgi:hypothetical protein
VKEIDSPKCDLEKLAATLGVGPPADDRQIPTGPAGPVG